MSAADQAIARQRKAESLQIVPQAVQNGEDSDEVAETGEQNINSQVNTDDDRGVGSVSYAPTAEVQKFNNKIAFGDQDDD